MDVGNQQVLLDRARQGDGQALGGLLESLRPYVALLARGLRLRPLQARVDVSDLVQEAMLEAHRSFTNFDGTTMEDLVAWLRVLVLRSAGHVIRAHLGTAKRDAAREQPLTDSAEEIVARDPSPSSQASRHEQAVLMAQALTRLPEDMQQVLLGRHMDDLPYAVLAERLGRSEGAVRVLYTRALRRLREECQR